MVLVLVGPLSLAKLGCLLLPCSVFSSLGGEQSTHPAHARGRPGNARSRRDTVLVLALLLLQLESGVGIG